jgi:hypothetical protein
VPGARFFGLGRVFILIGRAPGLKSIGTGAGRVGLLIC